MEKIFQRLAPVVDSIGTPQFEKNLAAAIGCLLPHHMMTMTRYSSLGAPTFLIHTHNFPAQMAERYLTIYHLFDPFLDHWRKSMRPGVIWLGDLAPSKRKVERYVKEFLADSGISDEVGIFLPPIGRDSVAFFYENSKSKYSLAEFEILDKAYSFVASLYCLHVRLLLQGFGDPDNSPSLGKPLRITDAYGVVIWQTSSWVLKASDLQDEIANAPKDPKDKTTVRLSDGNLLLREPISADLAGGENRYIWGIEEVNQYTTPHTMNGFRVGDWKFDSTLTARECDIVELILRGHPRTTIAAKLNIGEGTVKNHKRRIYRKLDITTERELFLYYMKALTTA